MDNGWGSESMGSEAGFSFKCGVGMDFITFFKFYPFPSLLGGLFIIVYHH